MDEAKIFSSSVEQFVDLPDIRARNVPDVPQDVDRDFMMEHLNDPYFDIRQSSPPSFLSTDDIEMKKKAGVYSEDGGSQFDSDRYSTSRADSINSTMIDFDDDSPYPEVRASVSSVDDPLMPVNTFRMWFLGTMFVLLLSGINEIFGLRYPSIYLSGLVAQIIALPLGHALAYFLPTTRFNTFGYVWSLNPGPFTIKEHVCITVMGNFAAAGPYSSEIALIQKHFYGQQITLIYQVLLAVGTQCLGFCLGGLLRQFVVWPASMIWPGALVNSALFNTLHKNYGHREDRNMNRGKFFVIVMACSFVWYWMPGYLFTALSMFNWVCWIAPNNTTINTLFGTNTGLGMSMLTFDWSMISFIGSPLVTPWWSQANTGIAFILIFWCITPLLYFTNVANLAYFPISSYLAFDNTGNLYDPTKVLTDGVFDAAKYSAYSPVFISTTLLLAYGVNFGIFTSVIMHTFLWFRKDVVRRFRSSLKDEKDLHSRLMSVYPEVPKWWYITVGVLAMVCVLVAVEIFPTKLPIWAVFFAAGMSSLLSIPMAMLQAITNQQMPTQVLSEMIGGYLVPGRPIANVIFKTLGFVTSSSAVSFAADLKLGHYMKIPPRVMFMVQVIGTVIACIWVSVIQDWMLSNVEGICTRQQRQGFICPGSTTFFTSSVIWGAVGPSRLFNPGKVYSPILLFFLIGLLAPIPFYVLARRYPLSIWRYINIPVFFAGLSAMPPASGINYISWLIVGFLFNYFVRRFHFRWWMRYNYILSAGLDAGVIFSMAVIFFTLGISRPGGININWWGNLVWTTTADANGTPLKPVPASGIIGPSSW